MNTRVYHGRMTDGLVVVTVNGRPLNPRTDLRNHSPDGFSWGFGGSGPSQLALALLADATGDDAKALRYYQDFKWEFVARLEQDAPWEMTQDRITGWVELFEAQLGGTK